MSRQLSSKPFVCGGGGTNTDQDHQKRNAGTCYRRRTRMYYPMPNVVIDSDNHKPPTVRFPAIQHLGYFYGKILLDGFRYILGQKPYIAVQNPRKELVFEYHHQDSTWLVENEMCLSLKTKTHFTLPRYSLEDVQSVYKDLDPLKFWMSQNPDQVASISPSIICSHQLLAHIMRGGDLTFKMEVEENGAGRKYYACYHQSNDIFEMSNLEKFIRGGPHRTRREKCYSVHVLDIMNFRILYDVEFLDWIPVPDRSANFSLGHKEILPVHLKTMDAEGDKNRDFQLFDFECFLGNIHDVFVAFYGKWGNTVVPRALHLRHSDINRKSLMKGPENLAKFLDFLNNFQPPLEETEKGAVFEITRNSNCCTCTCVVDCKLGRNTLYDKYTTEKMPKNELGEK